MSDNQQPIRTDGGALVGGDVATGGGLFVGRDYNEYHVSIHVSQASDAAGRYSRIAQVSRSPYRPDEPYGDQDYDLFSGRETEITQVMRRLLKQRTLVIYGPADAGKTSLILAGAIPELKQHGAMVIHLRDYAHAVALLRARLVGHVQAAGLEVKEDVTFPELAQAIISATGQGIILVMDQFERYFLPDVSELERTTLRQNLAQAVELIELPFFHILIAIRDDQQSKLDQTWGDVLPDLRERPLHLQLLDWAKAKAAIERPLDRTGYQASFSDRVVDTHLLPDLDALTFDEGENIRPSELQIVCNELYEAALDRSPPHMNTDLYLAISEQKGAEQIVNGHFSALLARVPEEHRSLAQHILEEMLDPELGFWVTPGDLALVGGDAADVQETLEDLVRADILIWHISDGRRAYAFASNSVAQAADRVAGHEARRRLQARNEQHYVWRAWIAYDALASRGQLTFLEQHGAVRNYPPGQALLLLLSAVAHNMPVASWLERLDTAQARSLIERLEGVSAGNLPVERSAEEGGKLTELSQVRLLLGITDQSGAPVPTLAAFGPIAWTAATQHSPIKRETAALALMVFYEDVLERLRAAVDTGGLGRWRMAELRAYLADANPLFATKNRDLPVLERLGVWWWRFRRRFVRDARYIGVLTLGAALGAALGLGLLRAVLAALMGESGGANFYRYFPAGFLLGAGLSLGLLLANVIRLRSSDRAQLVPGQDRLVPSLALGTLGFALTHLLIVTVLDYRTVVTAPLVPLMAIPAGLGLAVTVHDQPLAGWNIGWVRWILRLSTAAAAFALTQAAFLPNPDLGSALTIGWSGFFYESRLADNLLRWGLERVLDIPGWYQYAAVIDSALTGMVLTVGLTAGLILGANWYKKWQDLARRALD